MATVSFYVAEQAHLPAVCVKTGQPTADSITLQLTYRPAWPILLAPVSLLAAVVGFAAGARHGTVRIPLAESAWRRYRWWWKVAVSVIVTGGAGLILSGVAHRAPDALVTGMLLGAGLVLLWAVHMTMWCGFVPGKDCSVVTVHRAHDDFVSALRLLHDRS
jgi:hypothetical protein